jgi:hypothetical protein
MNIASTLLLALLPCVTLSSAALAPDGGALPACTLELAKVENLPNLAQDAIPLENPSAPNPSTEGAAHQQSGSGQATAPPQGTTGQSPMVPGLEQAPSLEQQEAAVQSRVVPLRDEPHHHLVLQNEFANVYNLSVPPYDATFLHRHDLPYVAINFGAGNVVNIVQGKSQVLVSLRDGQVTYSPGQFVHVVRTDSGTPLRNVTIELAKPQGTARNLCQQIVPGPLACPEQAKAREGAAETASAQRKRPVPGTMAHRTASDNATGTTGNAAASASRKNAAEADDDVPYFETDEVRVDVITVSGGKEYVDEKPALNALLVAMSNADLDAQIGGQHTSFLHDGDILWFPAGSPRRVLDFLGTRSNFLLVSFKDGGAAGANAPQQ